MAAFDPQAYGPACAALLDRIRPMPLGPGSPHRERHDQLASLDAKNLFGGRPVRDTSLTACCLAGLWLLHDFLDESHAISQQIHSTSGSFWHAIMHRREPDAGNSKYWWQRVGGHPVLEVLARQSRELGYRYAGPADFVDFCEQARGTNTADERLAEQVQLLEWQLLFDWCYRGAVGA